MNYNLSLFDLELGGGWGYKGIVKIDAVVQKASKKIVVNSKELEIKSAHVHAVKSEGMSRRRMVYVFGRNLKLMGGSPVQEENGMLL